MPQSNSWTGRRDVRTRPPCVRGRTGYGLTTSTFMRAKLGEQMEEYVILGVCNPPLAHAALQADRAEVRTAARNGSEETMARTLDSRIGRIVTRSGRCATIASVR